MRTKNGIYSAVVFSSMILIGTSVKADAETLWYNGDPDGKNASQNYVYSTTPYWVFDDFTVPAGGWTINAAWGNYEVSTDTATITQARWEIRSGVSSHNGGTLVAFGTNSATETVSETKFYRYSTVQVALPDIALDPGTYWLSVAPVTTNPINGEPGGYAGIETAAWTYNTAANAVGRLAQNDGNSFVDFPALGDSYYFKPAKIMPDALSYDYSMGIGYSASAPEPSSLALLGLGILGLSRRRR